MTDASRAIHRSQPGISQEQIRDARARAWAYVFDCFHRNVSKEGSPVLATLDNEAKEFKNDCPVTPDYT